MSVLLRRATVDDLAAIMRIEEATFVDDAWTAEAMRRDLESEHTFYLVATDSTAVEPTTVIGYAGLLAPRGSGQADIQTIAVLDQVRGRRIGRTLMITLIDEARRRRANEIFLEVRTDNPPAISLYRSLGFDELGVRAGYYPGGIDALAMKLRVAPARASVVGAEVLADASGAASSAAETPGAASASIEDEGTR